MKAADFQSQDNNRADAIAKITMFCDRHGYSYKYTAKEFKIELPNVEPLPSPVDRPTRKKVDMTGLDFLRPDPNGIHEDELPPTTEPLTEGESPKEEN